MTDQEKAEAAVKGYHLPPATRHALIAQIVTLLANERIERALARAVAEENLTNAAECAAPLSELHIDWSPANVPLIARARSVLLDILAEFAPAPVQSDPEWTTLAELEARYAARVLEHTKWNKQAASRLMNIDRKTLDRIIARHRIERT